MQLLRAIKADQAGATAVEYGLVLGLVTIAALGSMSVFANTLVNTLTISSNTMASAPGLAGKG